MDTVGFDPIMSIDEMAEGREAPEAVPDTVPDHSSEPALDPESELNPDPVCDFEPIFAKTEPETEALLMPDSHTEPKVASAEPEPEAVTEPEVLIEPEAVAEPEVLTEPEAVTEPDVASEPEPASAEPEVDTVLVPVALSEPASGGAELATEPESATESETVAKPKRPAPVLNKTELKRVKKRHLKNDNALIEARCYYDIRKIEMEVRLGDMSFAAKIDSTRDRHIFRRRKKELSAAKDKLRSAKKFEAEDNFRYYRMLELDIGRILVSKKVDRGELRRLHERALVLLEKRDEINLALTKLYSATEGKGDHAKGRFNAELKGRRAAYRRQLDSYRHYERVGISTDDKEILYPLMDERTVLYGELARINYMLKREHPKGAAKRALKKQRRQAKRKLRENKRKLLRAEKRALGEIAENVERGSKAALGFIFLLLLVGAIVALVAFWPQIQPWFTDTLIPWLTEKLNQLIEWATSLISGAGAEGGGE